MILNDCAGYRLVDCGLRLGPWGPGLGPRPLGPQLMSKALGSWGSALENPSGRVLEPSPSPQEHVVGTIAHEQTSRESSSRGLSE